MIGGRWSTGMLLGGVDNWLNGGYFYTIRDIGIPIFTDCSDKGAKIGNFRESKDADYKSDQMSVGD